MLHATSLGQIEIGVNLEKKGEMIGITVLNELKLLFLNIYDQYGSFQYILFSRMVFWK